MKIGFGAGLLALLLATPSIGQGVVEPIIDMHMHALLLSEFGGESVNVCLAAKGGEMHGVDPAKPFDFKAQASCNAMARSPASDAAILAGTIAEMDRFNIVSGVISGDRPIVAAWRKAHPARFIPPPVSLLTATHRPPRTRRRSNNSPAAAKLRFSRKLRHNIAAWRPTILR